MAKRSRWIKLLVDFSKDVRIASKEEAAEDDKGVPLVLWSSQQRVLNEIAEGLDQALTMPKDERLDRWGRMNALVRDGNARAWSKGYLAALEG